MRKPIKTIRFCTFFTSRRFFEREGPLERKSIEKFPKSVLQTPQIDQNRCPRAMLGRSRRPDGLPESILARSSAPDALPEAILVRSSDPRGDLSSIEAASRGRLNQFFRGRGTADDMGAANYRRSKMVRKRSETFSETIFLRNFRDCQWINAVFNQSPSQTPPLSSVLPDST